LTNRDAASSRLKYWRLIPEPLTVERAVEERRDSTVVQNIAKISGGAPIFMPASIAVRSSGFIAGSMQRRKTHMCSGGTDVRIAICTAISFSIGAPFWMTAITCSSSTSMCTR
jgi:hypothetical protein